jgi:hypothetical protein
VTAGEFAFLAMGLILGVAAGAALIEVLRSRPGSSREVRVTVATDAVPRRRAATLADDAFLDPTVASRPARGGPADRRQDAGEPGVTEPGGRTPVREPRPGTIAEPAFPLADPTRTPGQAVPVTGGNDPMLAAFRASAAASATAAMRQPAGVAAAAPATTSPRRVTTVGERTERTVATARDLTSATTPVAGAIESVGDRRPDRRGGVSAGQNARREGDGRATAAAATAPPGTPEMDLTGPCAEARHIADERCEVATRARDQAALAENAHRAAQRAYDEHETTAAEAADQADARAVRRAKDDAQARFRAGRAAAQTTDEVEAAARAWLLDINAINNEAREAAAILARERVAAQTVALRLERTALEADAARIAAETAEAACTAARQAVADCQERESGGAIGSYPVQPSSAGGEPAEIDDPSAGALRSGGSLRIFRLLQGDRGAMLEMTTALGGDDEAERRRWQTAISDLVDAILADALTASALDFPHEHPFWGPFNRVQGREITAALSSLGYRFDGRGGWVDDRIPSQRDLSLALGYAGIDPMRMRQWPTESDMADLFAEVQVSAAEHLAGNAGDLTLGELVTMLGRRADGLAEVWNDWGHIRPMLLEET